MTAEPKEQKKVTGSTPFAGCLIMILALAVMLFLVGFAIWSVFRLDKEIAKFTQLDARPVPVASLEDAEGTLNSLKAKLDTFNHQLTTESPEEARLALSVKEINLAIAAFKPLEELRGTFHVEAIENGTMRVAVSFKLNAKPLENTFRYLNGSMLVQPELVEGEILLRVLSVDAGPQPVPEEFLGHLSPYRITQRYVTDPVIGPAMKKLTGIELRDNQLQLRRLKSENPPAPISPEQAQKGKMRFIKLFGFIAAIFLVGVAAVLLIGLRSSRKRARQNGSQDSL
jgi:hypothetical protein